MIALQGVLHYDGMERSIMFRSITTDAIVIRRERMGEYHKSLTLLTSELGLINAAAYGAYKMQSRLRMGSEPFTCSRAALYHNPVKKSYTIRELEVWETFESLRGDLSRFSAASLWAEVIIKSYGAGESSPPLFHLFTGCLRLLDTLDASQTAYATVQFIWRFLSLAGYRPDATACDRCRKRLGSTGTIYYEPSDNVFLCGGCALSSSLPLTAGASRFLAATESLSLERAAEVRLNGASLRQLEECLLHAIRAVLEGDLKSYRFIGASP